ncbi:MAG: threonine--tRNA ligase [Candidatus Marinimicrobia bacterium]|nr:threonine--tRNA ligase [Candidatus Neomarinimicrobiota bacterium]MBL7010077.1 threonine--tRNA ligase [Candidatus Neomarinimicrobiota bacterium]MBL7030012.1 threonine--tRNA ligase [Candidatus Neomarinimicrobiota bacterium]
MSKITITLPDKSTRSYDVGITPLEIAESIGPRLAQDTFAASINGELSDATVPITSDAKVSLYTGSSPEGHEVLLHSAAHLMAQAVKSLWPNSQVTIGPAIENRFYYDFDFDGTFSPEDLEKIENKMREISEENLPVSRQEMSRNDAIKLFKGIGEDYKVEIIEQIDSADNISVYSQGDFTDLCRGPHVPFTGKIKHFKLLTSSGAYWRGDEKNKMLQRIYGTVFSTKKELKEYLNYLEEAKKRDHRKLGKELEIYTFDDEVGPGLPLWLPNGGIIIDELEALAKEVESRHGYQRVRTPHLTKGDLYKRSGHLDLYKDAMYPAMDVDGTEYFVKPMNCPHHHKIYDASPKSYRDLPYRISEYGTCYRYEKSGQLFGLMRVRSMQMNDAHIYCSNDEFEAEFMDVCQMYLEYFDIFGIDKYEMRLSLHDPAELGKKYIDEPKLWIQTEDVVRNALKNGNINFVEIPGEAAFYGPKIDVQVWSAIGKEFTLATNQVDFAIPKRFNLTYTDENGSEQTPLCIHRAPLSTHERFIGFLIEHYGGDFPLWLSPTQVIILPVSEKTHEYAAEVESNMNACGIRVKIDDRPEKIGAKIRHSELSKIPVMAIVGEKEAEENTVSIRRRIIGDQGAIPIDQLLENLKSEIKQRSLPHRES